MIMCIQKSKTYQPGSFYTCAVTSTYTDRGVFVGVDPDSGEIISVKDDGLFTYPWLLFLKEEFEYR